MNYRINIEDIKNDLNSDKPSKTLDEWIVYLMYYANNPALEFQFAMQIPGKHHQKMIEDLAKKGYIKYNDNDASHDIPLFFDPEPNRFVGFHPAHYDTNGNLVIDYVEADSKNKQGHNR